MITMGESWDERRNVIVMSLYMEFGAFLVLANGPKVPICLFVTDMVR